MRQKKVVHRGHEITVSREKCLAGYTLLYYSVFRESDGFECLSSFEDSRETLSGKVQQLRERIDAELASADPWQEQQSTGG